MPNMDNQEHYTTPGKSGTRSKSLSPTTKATVRPPACLKPSRLRHLSNARPCSQVPWYRVTRVTISGRALAVEHDDCHLEDCDRCQSPEGKARRMLERRGNWAKPDEVWAQAATHFQASGCTEYLRYDDVPQKEMQKLLLAMRRSHQQLAAAILYSGKRGETRRARHFYLTPETAAFVRQRLDPVVGAPAVEGEVSAARIAEAMDGTYRAMRGVGIVDLGASFRGKSPEVYNTPPAPTPSAAGWTPTSPGPPVSLREFRCNHLGNRRTLKAQGIQLPARYDRTDPTASDSNIDGPAIPVAEFKEETRPMMTRDQANELLELQRAMLREEMEQTELLRKQADRTQDDTDPHHVPARRRTQ
jgi:hypothetical protein